MSDGDALLSAILAEPDEDTPRLVYADWLDEVGDEIACARAELIRVQVELARVPRAEAVQSNPRVLPLLARENYLLTTHRDAWLAPLRAPGEPMSAAGAHGQFRRGFVEVVWMSAEWFMTCAPVLFSRVPARELRITTTTLGDLASVVDSPFFTKLNTLDVSDRRLGDQVAQIFACWRAVACLTTLRLRGCALTDTAAHRLAGVGFDWPLTELDLNYNSISPDGLRALRERFGAEVVVSSLPDK